MTETRSGPDLLSNLAHEFAERYRRGERPALTEYTDCYPELAGQIRDLFPALVVMEEFGSVAGRPPAAAPGPPVPEQLGEYRILREVGRGGMGIVYEAVQESLGRHVALKVLPFHGLISRTHLERFEREARAVARLHHSNIVPVFGIGAHAGVHYYAMQFIQGQGLDTVLHEVRRLRGAAATPGGQPVTISLACGLLTDQLGSPEVGPVGRAETERDLLPATTAVPSLVGDHPSDLTGQSEAQYARGVARLGVQVADAMAYAHRQGMVHRDIKPSNLLLDTQGVIWVTDFGLVKDDSDEDLTQPGDIVGTVRYMAPERFDGRGDGRSDIYSVGATLYELLTLRPAFEDASRARLVERVLREEPVPPRQLDPRIPRDLETIVLKAMAKDPARRYLTAGELAEDLRRFLADRPVRARRISGAERTWRWARRNPAVASLLGCVAALLVAVAVVSTFAVVRMDTALGQTRQAEREARLREAEALVSQAHGTRYSHRVGQRFETLAALQKAAAIGRELGQKPEWFDHLRNEAIACLALPDWRTVREWEGHPPGTRRWDNDERQRIYARQDLQGQISVRRVDTDEEIAELVGSPRDAELGLSPDGRFLVEVSSGQRRIWDLAGSPPSLVIEFKSGSNWDAFHPNGRQVVATLTDGSTVLYDLNSPRLAPRLLARLNDGPVDWHAFDPSGDKLALASANGSAVHILDGRSGKALSAPWRPKAPILSLAWHPSGKLLAAACQDRLIHVWDIARAQEVAVLEGWRSGWVRVGFTPDGEFVVSAGWEGKVRFWQWRTGQQVLSQPGYCNLRFSPEGRLMIEEGTRLKLVEVAAVGEYRSLVQQSSPGKVVDYYSGAIHPDGRLLAVARSDGARLWDLATGDEAAHIGPNDVRGVAFAPDALVTNGPVGLFHWPIRHEGQPRTTAQIGPPRLLSKGTVMGISCSKDGQLISQPVPNGTRIVDRDHPARTVQFLQPGDDVRGGSLSPDGLYLASSSFIGEGAKIWDTERRQVVKEFPRGFNNARFSPDGKWLAVAGAMGGRILAVGSWEEGPDIQAHGWIAFSPDGNLVAAEAGPGMIRLLDPATGREKARLEDPRQDAACWLDFTPDGTRLVAVSDDGKAIHVWDLRRIRAQLAQIGLDWDAPAFPEGSDDAPSPLEVRVIGAELMAKLHEALKLNDQAWPLLTGPEAQRNPARALELSQKAIELDPGNGLILNTLGVAQYRNGQYAAAIATLEKSLAASNGESDAFDLFFLAMCHAKLDKPAKAEDCFDRAMRWIEARKGLRSDWAAELKAFRAEAEGLLARRKQ
jgi:eukaryotic-like serine/threonine-protein kinase